MIDSFQLEGLNFQLTVSICSIFKHNYTRLWSTLTNYIHYFYFFESRVFLYLLMSTVALYSNILSCEDVLKESFQAYARAKSEPYTIKIFQRKFTLR